jgi:hypothetical protein
MKKLIIQDINYLHVRVNIIQVQIKRNTNEKYKNRIV